MAGKVIAQIIVQATAVISRAVVQAYGQALANAKKGGNAGAAVSSAAMRARLGKMQTGEALEVLNIERANLNQKVIDEMFDKYYKLNDPVKGGSFYLQSKFFRAKEALEYELNPNKAKEEAEAKAANESAAKSTAGPAGSDGKQNTGNNPKTEADTPEKRRAEREARRKQPEN
jgi:import inner membrane translocase subunit TIM16